MRSVQIERSTQSQSGVDESCLAVFGTDDSSLSISLSLALTHPPSFLPPFPPHGFYSPCLSQASSALGGVSTPALRASFSRRLAMAGSSRGDTMKALTPAPLTHGAGLLAYLTHTSRRSASNHVDAPGIALYANTSVSGVFQASSSPRRLADMPRRVEFVILRTASSPTVAPHITSQRRSYLRLRGLGLPRHGLSPSCVREFTSALGAGLARDNIVRDSSA